MKDDIQAKLDKAFPADAFMQPEIDYGTWHEVDGSSGTEVFPAEYFTLGDAKLAYSGEVWETTTRDGWGARIQAPGYMDATEWSVFDTEEEAAERLIEYYGEEEDA